MTKSKFQDGRGYSKKDWDAVSDNPQLTKGDAAKARPFREAFPKMAATMEAEVKRGRPKTGNAKTPITLRLDPKCVASFKALGGDWRARMVEAIESIKPA